MGFLGALGSIFGGGPSQGEKMAAAQQTSLADSLFSNYQQLFSENQGFVNQLKNSYSPIVAGGINQQGFSAPELASLNTAALNNSSAAARNAKMAAGNFSAGQGGGGTSGLQSGIQKQINASVASNATNQLATAQDQITQANYATGRQNYLNATAGLSALAGQTGSQASSAAGEAGSGFSQSFGEADKIQQEKQAYDASIFGGLTSLAGGIPGAAQGISAGISALNPNADTGLLDAVGAF